MIIRTLLTSLSLTAGAFAGITSIDLANYQHTASFLLPAAASEASAVTYNPDTGNLYVLGDEGDALVEVTRSGVMISSMTLTGFDDTEGLTYVGGGQFVLVEERLQDAYRLTYVPGGTLDRSSLPSVSLGDDAGNTGLEGISYEPLTGNYFVVKEKNPQQVRQASIDFTAGTATVSDLFAPALGVLDLSDIQVLSTVPSLIGTADQDNLLILSQESGRLVEVTRSGTIMSTFVFGSISSVAEGVTIDSSGTIYIVDEFPRLYVFTPIPEPSAALLLSVALGTSLAAWRRRRA